jgi:hypothetical protein
MTAGKEEGLMKRGLLIIICSIFLIAGIAECMVEHSEVIPERNVSWWSLIFERPNPEQLPVRVHVYWAEK